MKYAALWCKSNFSFLEGASHPWELVERAHEHGLRALALTDRDGVYGIVRAHVAAKESPVPLIFGAQVRVSGSLVPAGGRRSEVPAGGRRSEVPAGGRRSEDVVPAEEEDRRRLAGPGTAVPAGGRRSEDVVPAEEEDRRRPEGVVPAEEEDRRRPAGMDDQQIVLLAQNREGYRNLTRLLTRGRLRCAKGESRVTWEDVLEHADGLIALSTLSPGTPGDALRDAFDDRLYALATRHYLETDHEAEQRLVAEARRLGIRVVAGNEVLYHDRGRRPLQDVLTCVRHRTTLGDAGRLLRPNEMHVLHSPDAFTELFEDRPEWVDETLAVADRCTFSLSELRYVYPSERLPDGTTSGQWLEHLTWEGARRRYRGRVPDDVRKQIEYELAVIGDLDYAGYFLTMWEIVDYCRKHDILCQGRGSAANSAVCYSLGITAIDPVRMGLLFERFISRERSEPPDIDLDISHERREEVIQHVYEKYGRTHAAMVANFVRYRPKSAVRDIGKVLGIPETALDRLAKLLSHYGDLGLDDLRGAGLDPDIPQNRLLYELAAEVQDFPRHLSIHPGGFILGHEAVHDLVPIENASMEDRTVIQWDKYDVEDLELFKVDLLALGALTQLDKGFRLIADHRGVELDMATIPHGDGPTYDMICAAKTVGVFQIESRAQMSMLPRLRPREFYDLVIEVGIVRPGPITGDMVHPYLRRRNGTEEVTYPHPSLEPVLKKTLGIPLFQEQVMKLAVVAADYTPGEADGLRRDMAAWRSRGKLEKHREKLISRMLQKGIEQEFAERVYAQIQGFGEYGFPESHSASFALITYATCFMKCHYPVEFACSLLNSQPMGFYTPATIVDEAKREGVVFLPIDVESSGYDCLLEPWDAPVSNPQARDWAIRMGLRYVSGLREDEALRIVAERSCRPFDSIRDFIVRTRLSSRTLEQLAEAGALDCFGMSRRHAIWAVQEFNAGTLPLPFETEDEPVDFADLTPFETIAWDYRTSFHSPRGHPMRTIRDQLTERGLPDSRGIRETPDGRDAHYAGMVICRQRPGTAKGVIFMTMEDEAGFVNVIVWPKVYAKYRLLAKTRAFLGVSGRVQNEHGVTHIVAERLWIPDVSAAPPAARSRDFH